MGRKWLRVLGWCGVLLSMAIMAGFLWRGARELRQVEWQQFLWPGVLGLGLYGLSLALQAWVWTHLVSGASKSDWSWRDARVYFATHLTRRLPGPPWYIAGRVMMYEEESTRSSAALFASVTEWAGMLAAAGLWAILGYLRGPRMALALVGLGLVLWAGYANSSRLPWVSRLRLPTHLSVRQLLLTGAGYVLAWLLGGLILYLLVHSRASVMSVVDATSTWAVAGAASMVMVFLPAGLGIRELTLSFLLGGYVGDAVALVVALLMRVLFTLGDLIWGGTYWLVAHIESRRSKHNS